MKLKNYKSRPSRMGLCKIIAVLLLCVGWQNGYSQNSCATAVVIGPGLYTVDAVNGTNQSSGCSTASMAEWYVYTPTENHSVTVSSDLPINICKDTNFSVYTGTCTGGLVCYSGDDDSGVIACSSGTTYLSIKTFDVFAGNTYYIAWDNKWSPVGFDFELVENVFVPSPCLSSTTVTAGITTVTAIDGNNINTVCSTASLAKWYNYTPTSNFHVTISSDLAVNLCKDTNFSVYTGSCSGTLTCVASDDNSGILECDNGNTNSFLSKRAFDVVGGTTYYIVWDNKWSAEGFDFEITQTPIVVPITYNPVVIPTLNSNYNMCIVDMNGDHKDDLAGVSSNNLKIHFQGDAGAFNVSDFPIAGSSRMPSWSIAAGDMNGDGYNDLLLGSGSGLSFWKSNGLGTGYINDTPGDYIFCQRTNFADLNNDGHLDAFSCHDVAPNCYYLNDGSNNFNFYQSSVTSGSMMFGTIGGNYATLFADFDNDGHSDVFVSKCSGPPCELHHNNGDGTYSDVSVQAGISFTPVSSWSSAIADFDNDGDMDILVGSNGGAPSRLFRNNLTTPGTIEAFTNITAGSGWDAASSTNRDYIAYDFDNDGFVDVLGGGSRIMFNQGGTGFLPTIYSGLSVGAVGDLNDDGFLDILNSGNTVKYAVPNGNNWVKFSIEGVQSNKNGIGARIEIHGNWGIQIRDVRSGEGFGFMSTLNTHFGLGAATAIDQVIIRWPSGTVDTIDNPTINQTHNVVEGSTILKTTQFNSTAFSIYPNPTSNVLNILLNGNINVRTAQVFDLSGRKIIDVAVQDKTVSVKALSAGTYLLLLKDDRGNQYSQKFIKQ